MAEGLHIAPQQIIVNDELLRFVREVCLTEQGIGMDIDRERREVEWPGETNQIPYADVGLSFSAQYWGHFPEDIRINSAHIRTDYGTTAMWAYRRRQPDMIERDDPFAEYVLGQLRQGFTRHEHALCLEALQRRQLERTGTPLSYIDGVQIPPKKRYTPNSAGVLLAPPAKLSA